MTALSGDTSKVTRDVRQKVVPFIKEPDTTKAMVGSATVVKSLPQRTSWIKVNDVNEPVDLIERRRLTDSVKTKFSDIFDVKNNERICSDFDHISFDKFSDEVDTVGCFCTEKALKFFKSLDASPYVLDIIEHGHHPVLTEDINSFEFENNGSFKKHLNFAIPELLKLIKTGRVEVVKEKPKFINPLHVVVQPNKNRLILDCSYLNNFIEICI